MLQNSNICLCEGLTVTSEDLKLVSGDTLQQLQYCDMIIIVIGRVCKDSGFISVCIVTL